MDEYSDSGMDPEVKLYFRKIMKSFSAALLWMMLAIVPGLFFKLGYLQYGVPWYNAVFYIVLLLTLFLLLRFYYNLWRKRD